MPVTHSGRGAARLAHLHGVQGVGGSNPLAPTDFFQRDDANLLNHSEIIKTVLAGGGFVLRSIYGIKRRNSLSTNQ
jgi:hypothetical protein